MLETTFRVFNFRGWFGVSSLYCTLQSTLETTSRVFNFRDWFGVSCLYCTFQSTLETTFRVQIHSLEHSESVNGLVGLVAFCHALPVTPPHSVLWHAYLVVVLSHRLACKVTPPHDNAANVWSHPSSKKSPLWKAKHKNDSGTNKMESKVCGTKHHVDTALMSCGGCHVHVSGCMPHAVYNLVVPFRNEAAVVTASD